MSNKKIGKIAGTTIYADAGRNEWSLLYETVKETVEENKVKKGQVMFIPISGHLGKLVAKIEIVDDPAQLPEQEE